MKEPTMTFVAVRAGTRCAVLVLCSARAVSLAFGQQSGAIPPLVQHFLNRSDERVTSYRALRRLEAHNHRYKKHGWIEAWTTVDPESGFTYDIVGEGGSSYVRDKVLRKALEREAQAYAASETAAAAIDPANYEFGGATTRPDGLVSVAITPRRKDALLLDGAVFLTPDDADLVRIEGRLVKTPSFWTRRVEIVRRYGRIDNVRVPLAIESTAHVLVAGESSFLMRYEYASINGRAVGEPQPRSTEPPRSNR
jgi:hypothetical protein